ncbi:MAG: 5'-deoxynucleotidase [Acutalibacteraceae bacterium]|nr:5'-deoxynucleotidase [Acutalibacteraceae bacterium]
MKSNYYAVLSRMKNIYRWGLMRNTRRETLSEHSFEVAVIAHALGIINKERLGGSADPQLCATAALFHDTSEIITGDMPTPVKYHNPEIRDAYKKVEKVAEEKLISMLPSDMQKSFSELYSPDEQTRKIIKAADRISALIKCIEETEMGNKEFAAAKKSIEKSVKDLKMQEADIFLKEFIDGFSLTLDEQK